MGVLVQAYSSGVGAQRCRGLVLGFIVEGVGAASRVGLWHKD